MVVTPKKDENGWFRGTPIQETCRSWDYQNASLLRSLLSHLRQLLIQRQVHQTYRPAKDKQLCIVIIMAFMVHIYIMRHIFGVQRMCGRNWLALIQRFLLSNYTPNVAAAIDKFWSLRATKLSDLTHAPWKKRPLEVHKISFSTKNRSILHDNRLHSPTEQNLRLGSRLLRQEFCEPLHPDGWFPAAQKHFKNTMIHIPNHCL